MAEFNTTIRIHYRTGAPRCAAVERNVAAKITSLWEDPDANTFWFKHKGGVIMVNRAHVVEITLGDRLDS